MICLPVLMSWQAVMKGPEQLQLNSAGGRDAACMPGLMLANMDTNCSEEAVPTSATACCSEIHCLSHLSSTCLAAGAGHGWCSMCLRPPFGCAWWQGRFGSPNLPALLPFLGMIHFLMLLLDCQGTLLALTCLLDSQIAT